MKDCIFCSIIKGEVPASIVYSDEKVLAIMDIQPVNPGHVLVFPKNHATNLAELDEETGSYMFRIAIRISKALKASGLRCDGTNIFLSDGKAAFQDVFHSHLNIIPRFFYDKFKINVEYDKPPSRKELDNICEKIRKTMNV